MIKQLLLPLALFGTSGLASAQVFDEVNPPTCHDPQFGYMVSAYCATDGHYGEFHARVYAYPWTNLGTADAKSFAVGDATIAAEAFADWPHGIIA